MLPNEYNVSTESFSYCIQIDKVAPSNMSPMKERAGSTWALNIHEIGVRALDETLLLVAPLLLLRGWVQQVFCELQKSGQKTA